MPTLFVAVVVAVEVLQSFWYSYFALDHWPASRADNRLPVPIDQAWALVRLGGNRC